MARRSKNPPILLHYFGMLESIIYSSRTKRGIPYIDFIFRADYGAEFECTLFGADARLIAEEAYYKPEIEIFLQPKRKNYKDTKYYVKEFKFPKGPLTFKQYLEKNYGGYKQYRIAKAKKELFYPTRYVE